MRGPLAPPGSRRTALVYAPKRARVAPTTPRSSE